VVRKLTKNCGERRRLIISTTYQESAEKFDSTKSGFVLPQYYRVLDIKPSKSTQGRLRKIPNPNFRDCAETIACGKVDNKDCNAAVVISDDYQESTIQKFHEYLANYYQGEDTRILPDMIPSQGEESLKYPDDYATNHIDQYLAELRSAKAEEQTAKKQRKKKQEPEQTEDVQADVVVEQFIMPSFPTTNEEEGEGEGPVEGIAHMQISSENPEDGDWQEVTNQEEDDTVINNEETEEVEEEEVAVSYEQSAGQSGQEETAMEEDVGYGQDTSKRVHHYSHLEEDDDGASIDQDVMKEIDAFEYEQEYNTRKR
jgi:hypothetical protein